MSDEEDNIKEVDMAPTPRRVPTGRAARAAAVAELVAIKPQPPQPPAPQRDASRNYSDDDDEEQGLTQSYNHAKLTQRVACCHVQLPEKCKIDRDCCYKTTAVILVLLVLGLTVGLVMALVVPRFKYLYCDDTSRNDLGITAYKPWSNVVISSGVAMNCTMLLHLYNKADMTAAQTINLYVCINTPATASSATVVSPAHFIDRENSYLWSARPSTELYRFEFVDKPQDQVFNISNVWGPGWLVSLLP